MHKCHRHGAFPDGGGAPLYRTVANIAGGEHPGNTRLQEIWIAIEWPIGRPSPRLKQVRACDQISRFIANNSRFIGPLRVRLAADAGKKPLGFNCAFFPRRSEEHTSE